MKYKHFNLASHVAIFILFAAIAFMSYQRNLFGFAEKGWFENFDKFSESLVVGNIVGDRFGLDKKGWNLGFVLPGKEPLDTTKTIDIGLSSRALSEGKISPEVSFFPYASHLGIQGIVFSGAYKFFDHPRIENLNAATAFLMAVVIALLSTLYLAIYNRLFSVVFFIVMVSSPWVVSFARNLYWVPFTWFLPAVFAATAYVSRNRTVRFVCLIGIFLAVFLKSLAGYEYLTTITIFTCSVFLLGPLFQGDGARQKTNYGMAGLVFLLCVLGFLFALTIHASMRGDSVLAGYQNIYNGDVKRRTHGDPAQFDSSLRASLESSFFEIFSTYWNIWSTPLAAWIPGEYLGLIFLLVIAGFVYGIIKKRIFTYKEPAMMLVFFMATLSWFILGKAHSYVHTQLNYVLWYFGFAQALFYCLIRTGFLLANETQTLGKRRALPVALAMVVLVVCFNMVMSARKADAKMAEVVAGIHGLIDTGHGFSVIFKTNGNMVYYAAKCRDVDLTAHFVMHIVPETMDPNIPMPTGYENRDFEWPKTNIASSWNPFSRFSGSCHLEVALPYYKIREIGTGQYVVDNRGAIKVKWESVIKMPPPASGLTALTPFNLTDENWKNGISRTKTGFFVSNTFTNRNNFMVGGTLKFPFSGARKVTSIDYTEQYINVYLEGPVLDDIQDGYPNQFRTER